jgi:hypothetical protein
VRELEMDGAVGRREAKLKEGNVSDLPRCD